MEICYLLINIEVKILRGRDKVSDNLEKIDLITKLDRFNIDSNIGICITENKEYEKLKIVYSNTISDFYYNYIHSIKASNNAEAIELLKKAENIINEQINREFCVAVLPTDGYIFDKRDEVFDPNIYECVSNEVWQIYTDFENVQNIVTNCNLKISIEKTTDMELFSYEMYDSYVTGYDDDPYGDLDLAYKEAYKNYKKSTDRIEHDFYIIKNENEVIGIVEDAYDEEIFGIYCLAIKSSYRNKGIGKEVIKQLLQRCKEMNKKVAFLQTEKGFYPEQIYNKLGFKEICTEYYYKKKKE